MGFNLKKYVNIKNPLEKLVDDAIGEATGKLENALQSAMGDALSKIGLGKSSKKGLLGNLGDAILAGAAAEFFGALSKTINTKSKDQITNDKGIAEFERGTTANIEQKNNILGASYIFPPTIGDYYFKIGFEQFQRPNPTSQGFQVPSGFVVLPLPRTLEERHELSYNSGLETGILGSAAYVSPNPNDEQMSARGALTAGAGYALKNLKAAFGNEIYALTTQSVGALPNPNITAVFQAPQLRRHRFSWLLAPNNPTESETVRDIIARLKRAALPKFITDAGIALLDYPEMCVVEFHPWAGKGADNYLYKFKHCMIESVNANYAPDSPVFFEPEEGGDPAPAFILLEVNLLEIEYFTAEDFGGGSNRTSRDVTDSLLNEFERITGIDTDLDGSEAAADNAGDGQPENPTEADPESDTIDVAVDGTSGVQERYNTTETILGGIGGVTTTTTTLLENDSVIVQRTTTLPTLSPGFGGSTNFTETKTYRSWSELEADRVLANELEIPDSGNIQEYLTKNGAVETNLTTATVSNNGTEVQFSRGE